MKNGRIALIVAWALAGTHPAPAQEPPAGPGRGAAILETAPGIELRPYEAVILVGGFEDYPGPRIEFLAPTPENRRRKPQSGKSSGSCLSRKRFWSN